MALLNSPIILFCSERSGSNLIAKIFDAHPAISAPGASHLFKVMSECANRYAPDSDTLRGAVVSLFNAKVSQWTIDSLTGGQQRALLAEVSQAGEMVATFYAEEAKANGKAHVMTKENSSFRYLTMMMAQSTKPRFLFMTRDPRDMAVSWVNGPVMRGGVVRAAQRWNADQTGYMQAITQLVEGSPIGLLRYEDLLANPEDELRRVCDELDVTFSPEMMRFSENSSSAQSDAKRSAMWSNLDKPLLANNSNKFLKQLTDDEIAYIEAVNGPLMDALGYESARAGLPRFGQFESLDALEADLTAREPHEKAAYQALPPEERARFEQWSKLYAAMQARPVLPPKVVLGQ